MPSGSEFARALERHRAGDLAAAEQLYRDALQGDEDFAALNNLAIILKNSDRFDEAEAFYERAAHVATDKATAFFALGAYYRLGRRLERAEAALRRALVLNPDLKEARDELGLTLLGMGRFEEAWWHYEARPTHVRMKAQGLAFPEWRGEPLAGKRLIVWREQGYGDQIMMARFLNRLEGAHVTYVGPEALKRLFGQLPLTYATAPASGSYEIGAYDYWTMPMSLPAVVGATLGDCASPPYLRGEPRSEARASGARVGLMWRGEAQNRNAPYRNLPEAAARRLLSLPGVISLDPADTGAKDFQDTADLIAGLELVISVDTSVAHLSGAMGRPAWVLLGALGIDWQWMAGRTDSPWYPSLRLIRQAKVGDWDTVVDDVVQSLHELGLTA
jgi:hypothetical protein